MTIRSYLKFVELQTKLTSLLPFLLGSVYALTRFGVFSAVRCAVFFVSLFSFDMAATAINNYVDFMTANKREGFAYEQYNAMGKYGIRPKTARVTIAILLCLATLWGLLLVYLTNPIVLAVGVFSFWVGITYTAGPAPISRTPFGELFSGVMMGFTVLFLAVYIHVYNANLSEGALILFGYEKGVLSLTADLPELFAVALFAAPAVLSIANIMLANNICDMEDDAANGRKTLPIYIGIGNAKKLFAALYPAAYICILFSVCAGIAPLPYLAGLLTAPIVCKNSQIFLRHPSKSETFVLSVKNFALMQGVCVALMVVGLFV